MKPSTGEKWDRLSFASTLYLCPILDTLLEHAPAEMHDELRLGLQEALVNAAKHGNCLDPGKQVSVQYAEIHGDYWWIITDQGSGFDIPYECEKCPEEQANEGTYDCGRGLFILHQIFDQVHWSQKGNEVRLCKRWKRWPSFFKRLQNAWVADEKMAVS
ncbi:MAG: anti-sigma regulatory factor [Cyanobacteria bacterium P01_D01_bin.156]